MVTSIRNYAKLKSCDEGTVRHAIKTGKIKAGVVKQNNRIIGVDIEIADKEWAENYDSGRVKNENLFNSLKVTAKKIKSKTTKTPEEIQEEEIKEAMASKDIFEEDEDLNAINIQEAKRKEALAKARLMNLELLEKQKALIPASVARKALFDFGVETKNAMVGVADIAVDHVLAASNRQTALTILKNIIVSELEKLAKSKIDEL